MVGTALDKIYIIFLRMLMQNIKGWLIIGLIGSVLLTILIVIFHSSENSPGQSSPEQSSVDTDTRVHPGDGLNMTMYT